MGKAKVLATDKRLLGDIDFFRGKSIAELAREQGVGPIKDIGVFAGGIPEDEDVDEMLTEIYRLREPYTGLLPSFAAAHWIRCAGSLGSDGS